MGVPMGDRSSRSLATEPKHVAITNQLRHAIETHEHPPGSQLPSEAALVAQFNVARGTIRQAMASLRSEGLIRTSRGRPPIVRGNPLAHPIDDFFSFSSWVRAQSKVPGQRTIEISRRRRSETDAGLQRRLPQSEYVVEVVRLRLIDEQPAMIERSTFHDSVGHSLLGFDTDGGSIYEFLLGAGAELDEGTHTIDAVPADALDAELLGIGVGAPILRVRRVTTSSDGTVLEYSDDRYRPDRTNIRIRNSRLDTAPVFRATRTAMS